MNCEQFENRIQQQLDKRADLALDAPLQRHARSCRHCAYSLSLYQCLVDGAREPTAYRPASQSAESAILPLSRPPHRRRRQLLTHFMGFAAAAILLTLLVPWAPQTNQTTQPLAIHSGADEPFSELGHELLANGQHPVMQRLQSLDVPKWFNENVSANVSYAVAQIDLTGLGQVDLVSLMPREPVHAVQMLPAAIQSIEPYYRYSHELPVINYWSSSINYTIGLIRQKLPSPHESQPMQPEMQGDLGYRPDFDLRNIS